MFKKEFTIEVSLSNKQYQIAKALGVPIQYYIGELSPMAKIKRKRVKHENFNGIVSAHR